CGRAGVVAARERVTHAPSGQKRVRRELKQIYQEADRAAKIVHNLLVFTGSPPQAREGAPPRPPSPRAAAARRPAPPSIASPGAPCPAAARTRGGPTSG